MLPWYSRVWVLGALYINLSWRGLYPCKNNFSQDPLTSVPRVTPQTFDIFLWLWQAILTGNIPRPSLPLLFVGRLFFPRAVSRISAVSESRSMAPHGHSYFSSSHCLGRWFQLVFTKAPQIVLQGSATSCGAWLEMQKLKLHSWPTKWESAFYHDPQLIHLQVKVWEALT